MAGRVILTGFMGSGKTAVGRGLADTLGYDYRDIDAIVEGRMGMSIAEAFAREGEAFFRAEEEVVIREELGAPGEGKVISLGGGAVTSAGVREMLRDEDFVVWIDVDVATAFERSRDGKRPLAQDRGEFERLYRERESLYRQVADFVVEAGNRGIDELVGEVAALLEGRE